MNSDTKELLSNLHDLHKQATVERSHYYVGRIVKQCIESIESSERNLKGRDDFIVGQGLWSEFVASLPRR
jgi:hypothetical protein